MLYLHQAIQYDWLIIDLLSVVLFLKELHAGIRRFSIIKVIFVIDGNVERPVR